MDLFTFGSVAAGALLMVVVAVDAAVTTIHPDGEGVIAAKVQSWTWALAVRAPRGRFGRQILATSGPVMILTTFIVWFALFVVGFALINWPFLDQAYRSDSEVGSLGFAQALYYSGVTVTVLGYGDITPVRWPLQLMAVAASASGFALLTGILTYVIQIVSSLNERIHLAMRLYEDTRGSADGVGMVIQILEEEGVEDLRSRIMELSDMIGDVHDRLHRLPMVGLFYRSSDASRDPEPAIKAALESAVAARLLSTDERYARLRLVAGSFDRACQRMVLDMATQYLDDEVKDRLRQGRPDEAACLFLLEIRNRLELRPGADIPREDIDDETLLLAYRSQQFLDGLDGLTRWRFHGAQQFRR